MADLINDPNPDRFDGVTPIYEPEKIMVASLSSIRGLLVQSVVSQTGEDHKIYYFINDHLGTPQKLLDENADIVWRADYKPFGEAEINVNTFANQFRFPGQYYDAETGNHYNWWRYYDPEIGRYLTPDPIGLAGGTNLFSYAYQNPINFIDPFGLDVWVYNYRKGGRGYGHTGLIMPNDDGTYTRYSQGADNPKAPAWQLALWLRDAEVHKNNIPSLEMPGAEIVMIPTEHNDQIQKAIDKYIKDDDAYHVVGNNCADFANDNLNAADDINLPDKTIPNDYMDMLIKKYGLYNKLKK